MNIIKYLIVALLPLFLLSACSDKEQVEEQKRAKIEQTRALLSNSCKQDSDCIVTGCRNTLCRTIVEEEFCDHRIVVSLEDKTDLGVVEKVVKQRLTVREAETVRLGGYGAGLWTISFQSSQAQRERVEQVLQNFSMSGLSILHPNAADDSKKLFESFNGNPDIAMRTMRGAGALVEKQIRSGDMLSKDDIRDSWQSAKPVIDAVTPDDDIEHLWAYDIIMGNISYMRFWPVDRRMGISAKKWDSINIRKENGDLHVDVELGEDEAMTLETWTDEQKILLLMLGNEILATAVPTKTIDDGKFDIVIKGAANNEDLSDALDVLKAVAKMKGSVGLDKQATARVEHDIECHQQHPRECACLNGLCGWKTNPDYNACLYE